MAAPRSSALLGACLLLLAVVVSGDTSGNRRLAQVLPPRNTPGGGGGGPPQGVTRGGGGAMTPLGGGAAPPQRTQPTTMLQQPPVQQPPAQQTLRPVAQAPTRDLPMQRPAAQGPTRDVPIQKPVEVKAPEKPVEVVKAPEKPVEVVKAPEKPVEVVKAPQKPVEVVKAPEKPVEVVKAPEKPVEVVKAPEKPVEVVKAPEKPVEVLKKDDKKADAKPADSKDVKPLTPPVDAKLPADAKKPETKDVKPTTPAGPRPVAKDDKSALAKAPVVEKTKDFKTKPKQTIAPPTDAKAAAAFTGLTRPSAGPGSAVKLLSEAFLVSASAAAIAVASAIATSSYNPYLGNVLYTTVYQYPSQAPILLSDTAIQVVNNGQVYAFADTMASSFAYAKQAGNIPSFTRAVADAINRGGPQAQFAFSEAFARAYAVGGDARAGVIEATAFALCSGGWVADAWANSMAVAVYNYPDACGAVMQANVLSAAQCATTLSFGGGVGYVAGYCGL